METPPCYERHNTGKLVDDPFGGDVGATRLLDFGCGDGRVALKLAKQHAQLHIVGVDVNEDAVALANTSAVNAGLCERCRFEVADTNELSGDFDVVLLQLVISVVGGPDQRDALLQKCLAQLRTGGKLLVSASGISSDINEEYRELYARDEAATGERYTYYSRGEDGTILYTTHHFAYDELRDLIQSHGFRLEELHKDKERSSRRPDQAAWFLYAVASKPG